jgi:hypothetical protein
MVEKGEKGKNVDLRCLRNVRKKSTLKLRWLRKVG